MRQGAGERVGVLGKRNRHSSAPQLPIGVEGVVEGCRPGDDDDDKQLAASGLSSLTLQARAGLRAECR